MVQQAGDLLARPGAEVFGGFASHLARGCIVAIYAVKSRNAGDLLAQKASNSQIAHEVSHGEKIQVIVISLKSSDR